MKTTVLYKQKQLINRMIILDWSEEGYKQLSMDIINILKRIAVKTLNNENYELTTFEKNKLLDLLIYHTQKDEKFSGQLNDLLYFFEEDKDTDYIIWKTWKLLYKNVIDFNILLKVYILFCKVLKVKKRPLNIRKRELLKNNLEKLKLI